MTVATLFIEIFKLITILMAFGSVLIMFISGSTLLTIFSIQKYKTYKKEPYSSEADIFIPFFIFSVLAFIISFILSLILF